MAWMAMMGVGSVLYHRDNVAGRADDHPGQALDYYGSRGETPLVWGGAGALELGLAGEVTDDAYDSMFGTGGAVHPIENWRLVTTQRPGVELVVSAHKSVAMLGVIGMADDMHSILDAERHGTLNYLDTWMQHSGGRRGRDQTRTPTNGLTWAVTRHATSRAGDPLPHDHVLIANVTKMADDKGGWKAVDTAALRDILHAATAVGRMEAAHRAVELGYAIEPDPGPSGRLGAWRIAGVSPDACEVLSKRSVEIAEHLEDLGIDGYQAANVAARATRDAKIDTSTEELMPRWHAELTAAGHAPEHLRANVEHAALSRTVPAALDDLQLDQLARQVLGSESRLAAQKVFTRSDLIVQVAPHLHGQAPIELRRAVAHVLHSSHVVPLVAVAGARERAYCSTEVLITEREIARTIDRIATGISPPLHHGPLIGIARTQSRLGRPLSAGQKRAVQAMCGPYRFVVIEGVAGAGKTTAIDAAREAHEIDGWRVVGTATSGQAARTLHAGAGVRSSTVKSMLWQLDHQRLVLDRKTLVVLDEAGMTADPDLRRLLEHIEAAGAKLVMVGDPNQLSAVGPGGALDAVMRRHPNKIVRLDENLRQHDPAERDALEHVRSGNVRDAVDWYAANDRIHINDDRIGTLVDAVLAADADRDAGHDTLLIAWRRKDVGALNRLARSRAWSTGRLTGNSLQAPGGRSYAVGDPVVFLAPDPEHELVTSQRGTVTAVDHERQSLTVATDDGRSVELAGDALGANRLDVAYAMTVHRTQGATADRTHYVAGGGGRELAYVALSRARDTTTIHTTADTLDQALDDLTRDWSTERRTRWVLDAERPDLALELEPLRELPEFVQRLDRARSVDPPDRSLSL